MRVNNTMIVLVLAVCFLSFLVNASISTMIHFYLGKSHFIGLVKLFLKKMSEKNEKKDIPLVDMNEERKFSDDVQSIRDKENEELLSERKQLLITFALYMFVYLMHIFQHLLTLHLNLLYFHLLLFALLFLLYFFIFLSSCFTACTNSFIFFLVSNI